MGLNLAKVTYQGFRTSEGWEVVVKRPGQRLRLLELPSNGKWAFSILKDYLGDEYRAADLHNDFAALTIRRFTEDWEMSESEIEQVLAEVEILRLRWRVVLAKG
jgi:hypothetical protein